MKSTRRQRTLAAPCNVNGFGYWSSQAVSVEFRPAVENSGIVFVRSDLGESARVEATLENRVESARRTTLEKDGVRVDMVEHLLAALAGEQIDNCEVWVDAAEMPASDGSCLHATEALRQVGSVELRADRRKVTVSAPCRVGNDMAWIEARPPATEGTTVRYLLDYGPDSPISQQDYHFALTPDAFAEDVASARTFVLEQEAIHFKSLGYGKHLTYKDILVFGTVGPLDNELRFTDECARHKILDLVGDVSIIGCDIHADITAFRSGHQLNAELVACLLRETAGQLTRVAA